MTAGDNGTNASPAPSISASEQRDGEKHDVERVEEVSAPGLTTMSGAVVTMTWKTWLVIFVSEVCYQWGGREADLHRSDSFLYVRSVVLACPDNCRASVQTWCSVRW